MAKLTDVKTLDMVNGDITKIEYNGEVYEKVGTDSPQIDGFFKLKEEAPAEELFAKVNRPDNEPIVGDFVEFDLSDYGKSYFKVGKKYEVDEDKDVMDEEGDYRSVYNTYRPIKNIYVKYTQEQADQVAEVGDKILIVDKDVITHGYSNGDIVEVMAKFGSGDVKGDGTCIIFPGEYIVLTDAQAGGQGEQSEEVAEAEQTTPKVGDYVVALSDNPYCITVPEAGAMRVTEIDEEDEEFDVIVVELQRDYGNGVAGEGFNVERKHFRLATQEEIAETLGIAEEESEEQAEKSSEASAPYSDLEVGDKVMVVIAEGQEPRHGWGSYVNNNDIGTVVEIGTTPLYDDDKMVAVDFPDREGWYAKQSELIKVAENDDFLPGTVVKGDLSEEIYTIGERRLDKDGVFGKAYYVEGEGNAWVGDKQFEVLPKGEALRKPRIKTAVAEAVEDYKEEAAEVPEETIEVGDLVKVVNSPCALPNGSYFIVKDVSSDGKIRSTLEDGEFDKRSHKWYVYDVDHVELIAKAADVYA